MLESNMTEQDWEHCLLEWEGSLPPYTVKLEEQYVQEHVVKTHNEYKYLYVERDTFKATFFATEQSMSGTFGFWCPKSAIENNNTTDKVVIVAEWCKIKIIEFN